MKVKCLHISANERHLKLLGNNFDAEIRYNQISIGSVYTVLAMTCHRASQYFGDQPTVDIIDDNGSLRVVPICFFETIDNRPSLDWEISIDANGVVKLWPHEYFENPYFHDDLSNGDTRVITALKNIISRMNGDASQP